VLQRKDHFLQSDIDNALEKMNTDINTLRNSKDFRAASHLILSSVDIDFIECFCLSFN
jgi:hypothetical protein